MNSPNPAALNALRQLLGDQRLLEDAESLVHYGRDWTRYVDPAPTAIALPNSVEEVQAIIRLAREHRFALVPSGGRTGLSAGATAAHGELVVSMERMNRILDLNTVDRSITVEAGAITEAVQTAAEAADLRYPVDFASAGSSQIGGNIATNAGGIQVIRYGMTRDWVRGLKVVTGTGEVLELNKGLIKNNTGFDFRHLFIGSEGTLGMIVEATLGLCTPPADPRVVVLGVPDLAAIMKILQAFQQHMELLAFEFFSELALQKVVEHQGLKRPFESQTAYYALLEFEYQGEATDDVIADILEPLMAAGNVEDAVLSQSMAQSQSLWRLREDISETISRWTPYKNDISTRISAVPGFLESVDNIVADQYPDLEVVWFGHIGDGNLHLNILRPDDLPIDEFAARCKVVSKRIFEQIESMGGSISAEHGVGLLKKEFLHHSRSAAEIALMRGVKTLFDPDGIMNPGKVFDEEPQP